ncbi:DinB family protein [Scopulibacillus darangshiensis]|uniref:DinB family protein n=1 Tax=Scopulibacillus darangshiensis TaxID=442528 RepID=A0A4R2P534_9BACL|nr:DinB family protein [Scopulibacillus darangshiensis]TCP29061.1 DinB family protein [Scopulibacillus darangshiensis]
MNRRHDVFFNQLENYRGYLLKVLGNITEEEAEIIPKGFKNNIRWNAGHVFVEQYMWIKNVTREEADVPTEFDEWFGWGSSPDNFTAETPSLEELRMLLKEQPAKIRYTYGERLDETFEPTEMWDLQTIEQVLIYTLFHEGMHLQTILDIKKCMDS